ncbi:protein kinase-like protein [Penicillium bovifimosum]|uniref:Protein kinase-like protein n=1 Tax=Penicillium bovifimosum TaxID=126998 RepID=A0A9W9HBB3_9EURO|nr:protein kinase-like protein [Penicillium bovifimosum]KAJ5142566.1 protein kinase-like protein [Penicillium bovifimosum]
MDTREFQDVESIARGGISFVYQVSPGVVVKIPQDDDFARQQFCNELQIYKTFSQQAACAFIVQCFYSTNEGIFLEHMKNEIDRKTDVVTSVNRLEPLHLRLAWMNSVTQAIAFLETLNLAHGDLRPDNILLDGNLRIKVTDFDYTAPFGTPFLVCQEPSGRTLRENEPGYDVEEAYGAGLLGPRTEQFALGSIYYFINYGMEVYGDKILTSDPRNRYIKMSELLQDMQFPVIDCDPIGDLISKCWHNQFPTIASLAMATEKLLEEQVTEETNSDADTSKNAASTKELCQELEKRGLFGFLRSKSPPV